ncbi:MAG: PQQ-binding-like beta-propeller repeat protein [Thermoguttaceae bacterium]
MTRTAKAFSFILHFLCVGILFTSTISADDSPQWGNGYSHNNISTEKNLPAKFSPGKVDSETGKLQGAGPEVRFAVRHGQTNYSAPVIANGKILVGTNDCEIYDPVLAGDRGVLLCFDEKNGEFLWKLALPKYEEKRFFDYQNTGMISAPTICGDRAYLVSNRGEVLCLDLNGMTNGNDGPFKDEGILMSDTENKTYVPTEKDADIIWCLDTKKLGIRQHDAACASIVVHDGLLYINTTNGLNETYTAVECPDGASLLVVDAETGKPLAQDDRWVGEDVVHGQWSSPTIGEVEGKPFVFFGGGNGVIYAFEALNRDKLFSEVETSGKMYRIQPKWWLNGQPWVRKGEEPVPFKIGRGSESYTCQAPPVFADGKIYVVFSTESWIGAKPGNAELFCIEPKADFQGDISYMFAEPVKMKNCWTSGLTEGIITPPTISNGLVYYADRKGNFYCRDAATGELCWTEKIKGDPWGAPLVADGKVYLGLGDRKTLLVFKAGRDPKLLAEIGFSDGLFAPIVAANGTLFIVTSRVLYAIGE